MERRKFIKGSMAAAGVLAVPGINVMGNNSLKLDSMPMGILGRTGVKVSKLGFGCSPLGFKSLTQDDVSELVSEAFNLGINYFDTSPNYGSSEERMGKIIPSIRKDIFLVSKTEAPDYDGTWKLLEQSLKRLNTDHIDMIHIHNFGREDRFEDLDFTLSDKGTLGALREAKEQGIIRFIGASGHLYPSRFHRAIDTKDIDVLMVAVNYVIRHTYNFEEKVMLRAGMEDMGLVAMKVLGGFGRGTTSKMEEEEYEDAIRYVYSLKGLSTAVIGMKSKEELVYNVNAVKAAKPLSDDEMISLSKKGFEKAHEESWWRIHGSPAT